MFKKLQTLFVFLIVFNIPLAAQYTHIELTYQSFRPFINFQLDFNSYGYNYDAFERTYLKGYMDGVNNEYFFGHQFIDMIRHMNAYRAGYEDGFRDRQLLIHLRGQTWYSRHRFAYDDYYSPVYAIQIWLDGLSLAFLQAPAHRLPHRWEYLAQPRLKRYRKWMANRNHNDRDHYYRSKNVERRFQKRIRGYRQKLNKAKKKRRGTFIHERNRGERKQYRLNPGSHHNARININKRSHDNRRKNVKRQKSQRKKAVRKRNNRKHKREVRKRGRDSNKSKRKARSNRGRDRND